MGLRCQFTDQSLAGALFRVGMLRTLLKIAGALLVAFLAVNVELLCQFAGGDGFTAGFSMRMSFLFCQLA